jgi:hypothetical protein
MGNITKYLIFDGFDAIMQVTLLADEDVSSLAKPTDGIWLRMRHHCYVQPLEDLY